MIKYRTKQGKIIEAGQFLPPFQIPLGVFNVYSSLDVSTYSGQVWNVQGERVYVKSGERIVQEPNNPNRYHPVAHEVFMRKYELIK